MQQPALIQAGMNRAVPPRRQLRFEALGSLRLTLWLIGLLGLAVAAGYGGLSDATWALAVPLALLAANLAVALATHPTFRTQAALVVFHVALLTVILLAAAGRLTYLKGSVELSDGQVFDGRLTAQESGPLHRGGLERLRFASLGFEVDYRPGMKRAQTSNRISYVGEGGVAAEARIGDDTPLRLGGYRFYTSSNKGFAPEILWTPHGGGAAALGTIHMPSFPAQVTRQVLEWTPPGATQLLRTHLDLEDYRIDLAEPWVLRVPATHTLEIRSGKQVVRLRPGEAQRFAEGTLRYEGLRMWMGYTVFYDWTIPWMLAACAVAVLALAWHFAAKFRRVPWQTVGAGGNA